MFFVRIFFPQFVLNIFNNFQHFLAFIGVIFNTRYACVENYTKKRSKMSQIVEKILDKIQEKKFSRQKTLTPAFQENSVC